jgi:cytoskeletal protein CcmA (bactofilin family)
MASILEAPEIFSAPPDLPPDPAPFDTDTNLFFDRWLQDLQGENSFAHGLPATDDGEHSEMYFGSFPGSNCEIEFEGVLHFDGYSIGNLTSPDGTLVLTKRGRIEADVNVRVAVINGWVTGDITATDRVVLESEARVTGQIRTRALSMRLGAIFDGECVFSLPSASVGVEDSADSLGNRQPQNMTVAARA